MGLSQLSSSFFFGASTPNFKRFKHIGLIKTSSKSDLITDSAAGATAFSAGIKTYNRAIGIDMDTLAVKLIPEVIDSNISSGVISTSSITHATPASFYAHVKTRKLEEDIATFLPKSPIDFFAGGGKKFFFKRKDNANLSKDFQNANFVIDTISLKKPSVSEFNLSSKFGFLLADNAMPKASEGRGDFLPSATQIGLDYLSQNKRGFFLMVEGSQIDWGGHSNDSDYIVQEVLDFDMAIGKALDFAEKDGNTLVVVTADHETGGYTLASNDGDYNKIKGSFSTSGHSATLIPVLSYGPGSEDFIGFYENNDIFHKIMKVTNWASSL
ncbi:alkaline phosphatase [Elysia marginata]|uniref:Alkaline phosphatase n=1 Tax=Elysia marginata TaxID=1093978 RepID=A0AAV4FSK9_9GAST|nr:alkaline phosphatase [Elysia marginata]